MSFCLLERFVVESLSRSFARFWLFAAVWWLNISQESIGSVLMFFWLRLEVYLYTLPIFFFTLQQRPFSMLKKWKVDNEFVRVAYLKCSWFTDVLQIAPNFPHLYKFFIITVSSHCLFSLNYTCYRRRHRWFGISCFCCGSTLNPWTPLL